MTDVLPSTILLWELLTTDFIFACPAITTKVCSAVDQVSLSKASIVWVFTVTGPDTLPVASSTLPPAAIIWPWSLYW